MATAHRLLAGSSGCACWAVSSAHVAAAAAAVTAGNCNDITYTDISHRPDIWRRRYVNNSSKMQRMVLVEGEATLVTWPATPAHIAALLSVQDALSLQYHELQYLHRSEA